MKINKFWQICVYYILIHLALLCVYLDSRVFGLYPLDVLSYKNEKIHITNVEGTPVLLMVTITYTQTKANL